MTNFNAELLCKQAFRVAATDNAGSGYCAKGVANILEDLGLAHTRGDAYTWKDSLPKNGWKKLEGVAPENAPPGAVIVYDRNHPPGVKGGAKSGHVEMVLEDGEHRKYVSDKARNNWGGTVPNNFVGVYVNPALEHLKSNTNPQTPEIREALGLNDQYIQRKLGEQNPSLTSNFNVQSSPAQTGSPTPAQGIGGINSVGMIFALLMMAFLGFDPRKPQEPDTPEYMQEREDNMRLKPLAERIKDEETGANSPAKTSSPETVPTGSSPAPK